MEEEKKIIQEEEEGGIDFIALARSLWTGRKTIIIWTAVFMALGLFSAITMTRTYMVSSVMVPQMGSSRNSSLASLAGLTGFDLGANSSSQDLSPLVYPHIINSVPFRLELMHAPLHYAKADTAVSMLGYAKDYVKPTVAGTIRKYTIGLPGVIIGALKGNKADDEFVPGDSLGVDKEGKPIILTKEEAAMLPAIGNCVNLSVEKKEGYLTLTVSGTEPLQTAELAVKAQQVLQSEITRFRTEKAQRQLDYIQARYNEVKAEAEAYQVALARVTDRNKNMTSTQSQIEQARLQAKYAVASGVYAEMAKQLEQAKMQVKRDTPVLAVIQPITVPRHPSNSRIKTLIVWTFLGIFLGCGIVMGKRYLPKVKEMFAAVKEETPAEED